MHIVRLILCFFLFFFILFILSYRINKTRVLEILLCSIIEPTESEGLDTNVDIEKLPNDVKDPDDAAKLINRMDKMININKNKLLTIARKQGEIFKKFKTDNKFISAIKIGIVEFINMYPRRKNKVFLLLFKE